MMRNCTRAAVFVVSLAGDVRVLGTDLADSRGIRPLARSRGYGAIAVILERAGARP